MSDVKKKPIDNQSEKDVNSKDNSPEKIDEEILKKTKEMKSAKFKNIVNVFLYVTMAAVGIGSFSAGFRGLMIGAPVIGGSVFFYIKHNKSSKEIKNLESEIEKLETKKELKSREKNSKDMKNEKVFDTKKKPAMPSEIDLRNTTMKDNVAKDTEEVISKTPNEIISEAKEEKTKEALTKSDENLNNNKNIEHIKNDKDISKNKHDNENDKAKENLENKVSAGKIEDENKQQDLKLKINDSNKIDTNENSINKNENIDHNKVMETKYDAIKNVSDSNFDSEVRFEVSKEQEKLDTLHDKSNEDTVSAFNNDDNEVLLDDSQDFDDIDIDLEYDEDVNASESKNDTEKIDYIAKNSKEEVEIDKNYIETFFPPEEIILEIAGFEPVCEEFAYCDNNCEFSEAVVYNFKTDINEQYFSRGPLKSVKNEEYVEEDIPIDENVERNIKTENDKLDVNKNQKLIKKFTDENKNISSDKNLEQIKEKVVNKENEKNGKAGENKNNEKGEKELLKTS